MRRDRACEADGVDRRPVPGKGSDEAGAEAVTTTRRIDRLGGKRVNAHRICASLHEDRAVGAVLDDASSRAHVEERVPRRCQI